MARDAGLGSSPESGHGLTQLAVLGRDEQMQASKGGLGELDSSGPQGPGQRGICAGQALRARLPPFFSASQVSLKGRSLEKCLTPGLSSISAGCASS